MSSNATPSAPLPTCREIQQHYYNNLGNRDYDCFKSTEEKYLKLKIAYSLYGPPVKSDNDGGNQLDDITVEKCYDKEQNKVINQLLKPIKKNSIYNEDPGEVFASFMFNVFELKNVEKNNLRKHPIFRVKKCTGSPTGRNCCVFIDERGRVYKTWTDYLENNKLPKATMFVPRDGKYKGDNNNQVLLDQVLSPACSVAEDIKKGADITTTAASLVSGGVMIGSLIPAVTVAPFLLTGALVTGGVVGVYSIFRSSFELHDRRIHKESMSLANDEARNCYLNIAAGATCMLTTGATKAATVAINKGVTISESAATALLSVNAVNITVNGCNVVNSLYAVISDIKKNKSPSALDILHMTTTILFFGNAVVSFRSAVVIYKDSQTTSFSTFIKNQSESLWSRAKQKFLKSDVTSYENNSSMKVVNDSVDFNFNVLPAVGHERGMQDCSSEVLDLLSNFVNVESALKFGWEIIKNKDNVYAICKIILSRFEYTVQENLLKLVKYLLDEVIEDALYSLKKIFPKTEIFVVLLNYIINFLKLKLTQLEIDYHQKKIETLQELDINDAEYEEKFSGFKNPGERSTYFLKITILKMFCENGKPQEIFFREMIRFFWDWLAETVLRFSSKYMKEKNRTTRRRNDCKICGGYYFN